MAVAGFGRDDVETVQERNRLSVRGKLKEADSKTAPLHRHRRLSSALRSRRLLIFQMIARIVVGVVA